MYFQEKDDEMCQRADTHMIHSFVFLRLNYGRSQSDLSRLGL